jgi:hypothetical protein
MSSPISPIRKKRNFKALQLPGAASLPSSPNREADPPVPTRLAPPPMASAPVGKKRPPPMVIKAPKIPVSGGAVSAVEQDGAVLTVLSGGPHSASPAVRRNTYHATLSTTLANLDMNAEIKFDLKGEDLKDLQELGQGNGGSVKKVEHVPTGTIMAKKVRLFCSLLVLKDNSNHKSILTFRLSLSMQSQQYGNKSYVNYILCTTVTRNTSSLFGAPFLPIPTFASVWNSWTKVLWMAYTRRLVRLISRLSARSLWLSSKV